MTASSICVHWSCVWVPLPNFLHTGGLGGDAARFVPNTKGRVPMAAFFAPSASYLTLRSPARLAVVQLLCAPFLRVAFKLWYLFHVGFLRRPRPRAFRVPRANYDLSYFSIRVAVGGFVSPCRWLGPRLLPAPPPRVPGSAGRVRVGSRGTFPFPGLLPPTISQPFS